VIDLPQAGLALHARAVVLIPAPTIALLSAAELQALVAHEIGHEYVWTEWQRARQHADQDRLKELELVCDAIAAVTLRQLGMDPSKVIDAIEKDARFNRQRFGAATNEKNYPTVAERRAFARQLQQWLRDSSWPSRSGQARGVNRSEENMLGSVRPEGSPVGALIARGLERSETFRDLVAKLDNTDVVVYVRFSSCNGRVPACLLWASPGPTRRHLLIKIDRFGRSENELTALVAHELQHASEVASAPGITDIASFQEWFAAHGRRGWHGFETDRAGEVTRKVMAELAGPCSRRC
jgi:hypothetical protein